MTSSQIPKPAVPLPRRRSSFSQAAQSEVGIDTAPPADPAPAPAPRPTPVAAPAAAPSAPKRMTGPIKDILLSLPEDEKERMVNTIAWTTPHTGLKHQSRFIRKAIANLCEQLETKYNQGAPFPAPVTPED